MKAIESLEAWKVSRSVAARAYRLTLEHPLKGHFGASDRIRRAALSIPANIAEGYAQGTVRQMIRYTRIALGSAAELKGHLEIMAGLGLVAGHSADVIHECDRAIGLLVGLLKSLRARVPRHR